MMNKLDDLKKMYIGYSNQNNLLYKSLLGYGSINFNDSNDYWAYECFGDVEIDGSWRLVAKGKGFLKIYDDDSLAYTSINEDYNKMENYKQWKIYRRDDFDCLIQYLN